MKPIMTGAELIAEERQRQKDVEGWTAAGDDKYDEELVKAAMVYADSVLKDACVVSDLWPWDPSWNKAHKHAPLRRLAIAGALIAAEIDRRQRLLINNVGLVGTEKPDA